MAHRSMNVSTARLAVQPLDINFSLKDKVYQALKEAILSMNIYGSPTEIRLDERQLSSDLGVSRTPIREAISRLEQEGFLRIVQRKGVFVVRKTKREIVEMITVWAALEGMAARLVTLNAGDEEIATLRTLFATFENDQLRAHIDEYSETNIRFHQKILQMSKSGLIAQLSENLFAHVRAIRVRTIGDSNRVERSIIDHMHIIEALEARDTELAERLVRQHTLDLAAHVEMNVHYLD
ncbi:MAG TPA: GntR family transcriptional regulator [bacterium]|nr:GntR family transcriptional regulator [bacterium]